jgi:hypothetical protein
MTLTRSSSNLQNADHYSRRAPDPNIMRQPRGVIVDTDKRYLPSHRETRSSKGTEEGGRFNVEQIWIVSLILLYAAVGLMAIADADEGSIQGRAYTSCVYLFFAGLLSIFIPIAVRVLMPNVSRRERLSLVIILGLAFYAVKIEGSPKAFTFIDEYVHLRNTQNILVTHHLFGINPLLPTAAYYPGLGALCAGVVDLTGLSPFISGLLIIAVSRILISVCFFLVAEKVTGSSVAAAGAGLIYAVNPMFLFWSSSFSYEDLALPLAAFVVWWIARTRHEASRTVPIITVMLIVAVAVTHHIAAFALTGLLGTWWLAERFKKRPSGKNHGVGVMAITAASVSLAWFFFVARPAESYLVRENLAPALQQLEAVLDGHAKARHLYSGGGTAAPPEWYMLAGYAAMGLIMLTLLPALYRGLIIALGRRRSEFRERRRVNVLMAVAIAVAVAFPLSQLPRFTSLGGALASRSSEYLFTGLGCVLALLTKKGVRSVRFKPKWSKTVFMPLLRPLVAACIIAVVLVGDVTIYSSYTQLLPEPSNPQGYPWMVQPDVITASEWARVHLGMYQNFAVSVVDSYALATYGEQNTVAEQSVWPIFLTDTMDKEVVNTIRETKVRYLFVDWRMTRGIPTNPGNFYFSQFEPQSGLYTHPLPAVMLQKFSTTNCAQLIYSSGPIQIFDVTKIEDGTCVPKQANTAGK